MDRPIDHSAVLLPGNAPKHTGKLSWGRLFFVFMYATASAAAIVLLGMSWRHEVDRRQAAEGRAAASQAALQTSAAKIATLEDRNQTLRARAKILTAGMSTAQRTSSRRADALRDTRVVLRATKDFVAALDGLDEITTNTVKAETDLVKAEERLTGHVDALSRYLRDTSQQALERPVLRTRLRTVVRDLEAIQGALGRLTDGKDALDKAGDPLRQTQDLTRSLDSALARTKAALRR